MNDEERQKFRRSGEIAAQALQLGLGMVDDGVYLLDVAEEVENYIRSKGALPAFPVNLSINEVAAHYTPKDKDKLRFDPGDVVKVDVGAHIDGYVGGDTAGTVEVTTNHYREMIESAVKARDMAMEIIGDGLPLNSVGRIVEESIKSDGFLPIANLTGHQIDRYNLHAGLTIPNVDDGNMNPIRDGMILAVEPFVTNGEGFVKGGKPGNIYRVIRERPIKDEELKEFYNRLVSDFNTLPFCDRWCTQFDSKAGLKINKLVRHGLVSSYATLLETKRGCVTQSEHTVLIKGSKAEILTLP